MPARADAGYRLHRLLAVLTWLARQGRAPVTELAERFGISPDELIADLELAACCGLPPYTPDQLMAVSYTHLGTVNNLTAMLEPILTVVMGSMVGLMVVSMYLPMFDYIKHVPTQ